MIDGAGQRNRDRAAAIRRRIGRSADRFWRPGDFDAPDSTVLHILGDAARAGELRRIRKGLYWRGTHTVLGMSPPPPAALIRELVGSTGVGPCGLSAANTLRLSTQIPRKTHIAVPRRPPADEPTIEFVGRPGCTGRIDAKLTAREVAVLEVLADPASSELPANRYWDTLRDEIASKRVRPANLAKAGKTESASTRVRLASLLETAGLTKLARSVPPADHRVQARIRGA